MFCPMTMTVKRYEVSYEVSNTSGSKIFVDYGFECSPNCAWWDYDKGQCCILTLSQLKISGGVNTHGN